MQLQPTGAWRVEAGPVVPKEPMAGEGAANRTITQVKKPVPSPSSSLLVFALAPPTGRDQHRARAAQKVWQTPSPVCTRQGLEPREKRRMTTKCHPIDVEMQGSRILELST